jgi:hypothetical protein
MLESDRLLFVPELVADGPVQAALTAASGRPVGAEAFHAGLSTAT